MYIIYIYIVEKKYTWKIPVAAIHIEGKQYLQGHAGTKYLANGFPEHGDGFTVWSHSFIFLAINVLPKYALCRYRTQTSEDMVIEINLTELLKQSNVIPPPKKTFWWPVIFAPCPTGTYPLAPPAGMMPRKCGHRWPAMMGKRLLMREPHLHIKNMCIYIYIIYIYTLYIYTHIVSNCTIICIFFNI